MRFFELVKDKIPMLYSNKIHCVNGFMVLKIFFNGFFLSYVNVRVFMVKLSFFLSFSLQNLSKIKFSIFIASDVLHLSRILKLHLLKKKEIKDKLDVLVFMATSDVTDWN